MWAELLPRTGRPEESFLSALHLPAGRLVAFKDSKAACFPSPRPSFVPSPRLLFFFYLVLALVLSAHPLLESSEAVFFFAAGGELEDEHVFQVQKEQRSSESSVPDPNQSVHLVPPKVPRKLPVELASENTLAPPL